MIVSGFEVGVLSPVEVGVLSSLWESNGTLPEDWVSELRRAGSERPFSAFGFFGYLVEENPDPGLYLEAIGMFGTHRASAVPGIAAASLVASSLLVDWAEDVGLSLPYGLGSRAWLEQSTILRPDWVKNWVLLSQRQLLEGDWAAAIASAERSVENVAQASSGSDPVTNAFEWLFTGRFGWSAEQGLELAERARNLGSDLK